MRRAWLVFLALSLPGLAAAALPPPPPGGYTFVRDPDTGCVIGLSTSVPDAFPGPCTPRPLEDSQPIDRALEQLWGEPFCLRRGLDDIDLRGAYWCADHVYLTFRVRYRGVTLTGELHVRLDRDLHLDAVGGGWIPGIDVDPVPTLTSEEARAIAATAVVGGNIANTTVQPLTVEKRPLNHPWGADRGFDDPTPGFYLVWRTVVHVGTGWIVTVDAHTGRVLSQFPVIQGCVR